MPKCPVTFSVALYAASQTLILVSLHPYRECNPADALSPGARDALR